MPDFANSRTALKLRCTCSSEVWVDSSHPLLVSLTRRVVSLRNCGVLRKLKLIFETSPQLYRFVRDTLKTLESRSLSSLTLKCFVTSQDYRSTLRDDWNDIDTILSERKVFIRLGRIHVSISSLCDQEIKLLLWTVSLAVLGIGCVSAPIK